MNQLFLIGRLTKDPEFRKFEGKSQCRITLAVKRQFKNTERLYDSDFITCTIWNGIADKISDFCKKGDLISLKGRIQNNNYTDKNDNKIYTYEIIAEQISFLQSQNKDKQEEFKDAEEK